jgi:uncharacterized protein YraI
MHQTSPLFDRTLSGEIRHGSRFYRITTLLTIFAMLFGGILLLTAPAASANSDDGSLYVIDGALNLRSGATTDDEIITVMPDGSPVMPTGEESNGFIAVIYNGEWGWAYGEFLSSSTGGSGSGRTQEDGTRERPESVWVGDSVIATGVVSDGPLNLRSGPSTSHDILTVMPHGASLEIMGDVQDGFHPVRYNGQEGWAYAEFVSVGGDEDTPPPAEEEVTPPPAEEEVTPPPAEEGETPDDGVETPGGEPTGTAMVIDGALNLRSGPGTTYDILAVMPNSSEVSLLGDPQNGFYPVRFNGTDGWAFADYLSIGGDTPDPEPEQPTDPTPEPETPDDGGGDSGNGDTNGDGTWSRDELVAIIEVAAAEYGQPVEDMIRVAGCESVWDPYAVNSSSGASGLFQFMPGTWLSTPFADQDIFDPVANAHAAAWMWSVGRRNEWSCQ